MHLFALFFVALNNAHAYACVWCLLPGVTSHTCVYQARDERVSLGAKIGSLKEDLASLWAMLGKSDGLDAAAEAISHKPLRAQVRGGRKGEGRCK